MTNSSRLSNPMYHENTMVWGKKISNLIFQTAQWNQQSNKDGLAANSTQLLNELMAADISYMLRLENNNIVTSNLSGNNSLIGLGLDSSQMEALLSTIEDNFIIWQQTPSEDKYGLQQLLVGCTSAVLICLEDNGSQVILLFCWNRPQYWPSSFNEFVEIAQLRINEMFLQSNKQNALEKIATENKAKSQLLDNMGHELSTCLGRLTGITNSLLYTNLSAEQKEFTEAIRSNGERLSILMNDNIDFYKIESGCLKLENKPMTVASVIEETFDLLSSAASKKQLELLYFIEPSVPAFVLGDAARLKQVLLNIVCNGINFTNEGQVYIYVNAIRGGNNNVDVAFMVQDSGIGMPDEKLCRLFNNVSQDNNYTQGHSDTYFGMAICKKLVELMNGKIWIESKVGAGTTFHFTMATQIYEDAIMPELVLPQNIACGKKMVLILDDNAVNLTILKKQFEYWGMEVEGVQDVHEAIAAMQRNHYDLALIDMAMPILDGIQTARYLKSRWCTKSIPLVLISSGYSFLSLPDTDRSMFVDILNKPIKHSHLFKCVNRVLGTAASVPPAQRQPRIKQIKPWTDGTILGEEYGSENVVIYARV